MFTFTFTYSDKSVYKFEHITKVQYNLYGDVTVGADEIQSYKFPTDRNLYLFAEDKSYSAAPKGLVTIEVAKEEV